MTNKSLNDIFHNFAPPDMFMADGGKHFKNQEVAENCEHWGTKLHMVMAYSLWVNGLTEGTNKLLLYVLAMLCAPEVGKDSWQVITWDKLPTTWPDHFDKAIHILNWSILPALKFCPKEISLGLVINTLKTPMEVSSSFMPQSDIDTHMAYVVQQYLNGYAEAVHHAIQQKGAFNCRVTKSKAGIVVFEKGQLAQVYNNKLALTLGTEHKLTPLWSPPHHVTEHLLNSYRLETLEGTPLDRLFNTRHLRSFMPREGTELAMQQKEYEDNLASQVPGMVELGEAGVVVPTGGEGEGVADEELGGGEKVAEEDLEELELEDQELEVQVDDSDSGAGFVMKTCRLV